MTPRDRDIDLDPRGPNWVGVCAIFGIVIIILIVARQVFAGDVPQEQMTEPHDHEWHWTHPEMFGIYAAAVAGIFGIVVALINRSAKKKGGGRRHPILWMAISAIILVSGLWSLSHFTDIEWLRWFR